MPPAKKQATKKVVSRVRDKDTGVTVEFPLDEDHYFTSRVTTPLGHHGVGEEEQAQVRMIQEQVGLPVTGVLDDEQMEAVSDWREEHGLGRGTFVDDATWERMKATPVGETTLARRSTAPSGGVDGADEANGPSGHLDPPQGP